MVDSKQTRKTRAVVPAAESRGRRDFLKTAATGTAAGVAAAATGLGFNIRTAKAQGMRWKMQSSWAPGTTGYKIFEQWTKTVGEVTGGELQIQPFPAGAVSGDFELVDAVRNGVLDGMNLFTVYWAGRMPAGVFFSSFPMGLNHPHQWDMLYGSYGGKELVRELYEKNGLYFVGHVHHDMNLIHSKTPIRSLDDFSGVKLRMPGGIVAETFSELGARTTLLPGSDVYPALEKGTIDAADYTGPAVNYELGFQQVTDYIIMGPPSTPCLHQPVDLMDISVGLRPWSQLDDRMKTLFEELVHAYSYDHYTGIQEANKAAWGKFRDAGTEIIHLSEDDAARFRQVAMPLWYKWANKDPDAARMFKLHLDVMMSPAVAYLEPEDVKDYSLNL
ncbi:TRAP transporter substrate-binding protein DctP [Caenispirillum salinarum]|uniref:TRAP transporter substrate-binding protein DctP n=1 Tax=Caenispirillum salinarum TaxID=859058 RepID=UPI00384DCBA2